MKRYKQVTKIFSGKENVELADLQKAVKLYKEIAMDAYENEGNGKWAETNVTAKYIANKFMAFLEENKDQPIVTDTFKALWISENGRSFKAQINRKVEGSETEEYETLIDVKFNELEKIVVLEEEYGFFLNA